MNNHLSTKKPFRRTINCRIVVFTLLIGLVQQTTFGRNPVDDLFDKYKNQQGILSMELTSNLLNFFVEDEGLKGMKMGALTLLTVEDDEQWQGVNFYDELKGKIDFSDYEELMRVHEKDQDVIMLALPDGDVIQEFLVIVGGDDNAIIRFTGQFGKDELDKLKNCNIVADLK
jgi:hypothetical protein